MLVISRHRSEAIVIQIPIGNGETETVRVKVVDSRSDRAKLGIEAARHVRVDREEIAEVARR